MVSIAVRLKYVICYVCHFEFFHATAGLRNKTNGLFSKNNQMTKLSNSRKIYLSAFRSTFLSKPNDCRQKKHV